MEYDEHDNDDWLRILAGGMTEGAQPATVAEARALRQAIIIAGADQQQHEEHLLQKLLFRLKKEGLLKRQDKPWWLRPSVLSAMAASLVGVTVMLPLLQEQERDLPGRTDPPTVKGGEVQSKVFLMPQTVRATDPTGKMRQLAAELQKLGAAVQPVAGKTSMLEILLPPSPGEELLAILKQEGLRPSPDGRLLVIVVGKNP